MSSEEFKLPPENVEGGNRYESSQLDVEELRQFLLDTKFEDEASIEDLLTKRYELSRRDGYGHMQASMTRIMSAEEIRNGNPGQPLSGREPQPVIRVTLKTIDGQSFNLTVFQIYNRNNYFRYEYTLIPEEGL